MYSSIIDNVDRCSNIGLFCFVQVIRDSLTSKDAIVPLLPTLVGGVLQLMRSVRALDSKQVSIVVATTSSTLR
jgi:hypothetical protein